MYVPLYGEVLVLADDADELVGMQLHDTHKPVRGPRREQRLHMACIIKASQASWPTSTPLGLL
jgi:hypothetical protein